MNQTFKNSIREYHEELWTCPYDPVHSIRPDRFGTHLVKCRNALKKQPTSPYYHKIDEYGICRWNTHHHLPKVDLPNHEGNECASRVPALKIQNDLRKPTNHAGITPINVNANQLGVDDDDDDWDCGNVKHTYDPMKKAETIPMFIPAGLTKSERRNYRDAKRRGEHIGQFLPSSECDSDERASKNTKSPEAFAQRKSDEKTGQNRADLAKKTAGRGSNPRRGLDDLPNQFYHMDLDGSTSQVLVGRGRGRGVTK